MDQKKSLSKNNNLSTAKAKIKIKSHSIDARVQIGGDFMNININRIGGNRPSDYYTQPNQEQTNLQSPMSIEIKPL